MEKNTLEIRSIEISELRVGDKPNMLVGKAIPYGSLSKNLGHFRERILPGAATRSLADGHAVRALVNHDGRLLLGTTANRSLVLTETNDGLMAQVELPATSYANDLAVLVQRGDAKSMSFGFFVPKGSDSFARENGESIRTIRELDLHEVSFLTLPPAYDATSMALALRVAPDAIENARTLIETPRLNERRMLLRRLKLTA